MHIRSKYSRVLSSFMFIAILSISFIMATFFIFPSYSIIGTIVNNDTTSALTYSTNADVSFTFNPTLSISLSDTNINIDNLLPGLSSESSPITVSVNSNTPYGYSLFASVGNSTDYNTTSLTHEDSSTGNNAVFTSIDTNAAIPDPANFNDNTWGYSFSNDNGSTWSNYNGLPLYSTVDNNTSTNNPALLIDTKNPSDNKSIDFKIAAKASSTQASGTYNNIINFYAVGKAAPVDLPTAFAKSGAQKTEQGYYRIQDMTSDICNSVEVIHSTIRLQDVRDNQIYTVAKLKDNKCWMTENLNLAGGTEITSELSDVPEGYTLPTENGFQSGNRLPESSQNGFNDRTKAYLYNTNNNTSNCSEPGCYGYYSWTAATAGSSTNAITEGPTDAPYSICPKGWKIPTTRASEDSEILSNESDFYNLTAAYGNDTGRYAQNSSAFYRQAGPGTIPNFLLSSGYDNDGFRKNNENYDGFMWSSTILPYGTHYFIFVSFAMNSASIESIGQSQQGKGFPVRCLAR